MSSYQFWQLPPQDQRKDESSLSLQTSNEIPKPGPTEVLLRVKAVSLNFRDLIIARNMYPLDRKSTRLNSSHSGESRMPSSA